MSKTRVVPFARLNLKVYGYTLPDTGSHQGLVKVGETIKEDVLQRIRNQVGTAGLRYNLLFERRAKHKDGHPFRDTDLHSYYKIRGIKQALRETGATEWFDFKDISLAEQMTDDFIARDYRRVQTADAQVDYILRAEQQAAVQATLDYMRTNPDADKAEFLWNAKPRFGKTLTTYDLARKMKAQNILIVTNRPAISHSWFDDFMKFIAWQETGLRFVSETDALADTTALTREQFLAFMNSQPIDAPSARCLAFISLQDLKGARFAGGLYDKLEWVPGLNWDLLVIDEAHEGVDTFKTDRAFEQIKRRFTLHLSGTPFKAIASQKFSQEQIFNWSYLDEQQAKINWVEEEQGSNPYAALPTLNLFTYQMSRMVEQYVARGMMMEDGTNLDYAFDLGEFFSTNDSGKFVYETEVKHFLDNLSQGEFPYSKAHHRDALAHTFWLLPRVAACKAMERLLKQHAFFRDYEVVLAAGDGISNFEEDYQELSQTAADEKSNLKSYDKVKQAIATHDKTITLSVTQLTTGVTIPEWTGVFMLNNVKSPALYFQAAFRAQNPYEFVDKETGEIIRKENAYVFDFAPDRTLTLFDELANNLSSEGVQGEIGVRQDRIREMINFFPVIAEDEAGQLYELNPNEVLTIPSRLKAQEVVKRGFMSNLLFANISAIFSAPQTLQDILNKIRPEKNKRLQPEKKIEMTKPSLNEEGEVSIQQDIVIADSGGLFGDPVYAPSLEEVLVSHKGYDKRERAAESIAKELVKDMGKGFEKGKETFAQSQAANAREISNAQKALSAKVEEDLFQHERQKRLAEQALAEKIKAAETPQEVADIQHQHQEQLESIDQALHEAVEQSMKEVAMDYVESHLIKEEEKKKKTTEDGVRDHLRGFARTIPAFLMAYGTRDTTLMSFETNIHQATFEELTSITMEEFRQLRDGFTLVNEDGEEKKYPGLFNQVVFDAAIQEFFDIKDRLADYLHTDNEEDIFDYIPPQQTNQIFTPRKVVKLMVDLLQQHAPNLFTSMDSTFIDLYSKSGLYITEIVKRLFHGLKDGIPDEAERIQWILEEQVYACAPSDIIYNMVKNYVYGGFPTLDTKNLLQLDLIPPAKEGNLAKALKKGLGKNVKFDAIIGNPPYQKSDGGHKASAIPLYHEFILQSRELKPEFLAVITPSRWFTGGRGLDKFRDEMLNDHRIKELHDYEHSIDCFPDVDIAGGVSYFIWANGYKGQCKVVNHINGKKYEKTRNLNIGGYFIRSNKAVSIVEKVLDLSPNMYDQVVSAQKPFGLRTYVKPEETGDLVLRWNGGKGPYPSDTLTSGLGLIDKWKVIVSRVIFEHAGKTDSDGKRRVLSILELLKPYEICTETYIVVDSFIAQEQAANLLTYLRTKFVRFLILQIASSIMVTKNSFGFVPIQDFSRPWTDRELYNKYGLNDEEIAYIESMIRPMPANGSANEETILEEDSMDDMD